MSVLRSHSYCKYSSPLCCAKQTCKNYMTNSFTRKFPLFICHLSCFVKKNVSSNWFWGRPVSEIKWRVKPANKSEQNNTANAAPLFPHWTENNSPYHSVASKGAQSVYSPSVPSTGYFNVCSQILSRQMKESTAPLRDGSPHTECMSDWLLSYQLNLSSLQRRALAPAWRGQTRNKGFPNNTKSQIGAFRILRHYNAAGLPQISSFFTFPPLPTQFIQL